MYGRENAKSFLKDNPEIMVEVSEKVRANMGIGDLPEGDADDQPIDLSLNDDVPITLDD